MSPGVLQVSLSDLLPCPQVSPCVPKYPPCPYVPNCLQASPVISKCPQVCMSLVLLGVSVPSVSPSHLRCPSMSSSPQVSPLALPCVSPSLCWHCPCMLPVSPAVPKMSPHVPVVSPHGAGSEPRYIQRGSGRSHGHRSHRAGRARRGGSLQPLPPPPPCSAGLGTAGHGHWE